MTPLWNTTLLVAVSVLGVCHASHAGGVRCTLHYYKIDNTNVVNRIKTAKQPHLDQGHALWKRASTLPESEAASLRDQAYSHYRKAEQTAIAVLETLTPTFTRQFYVNANGNPVRKSEDVEGKRLSAFVRTRPGVYGGGTNLWVDATYTFKYGEQSTSAGGASWTTGKTVLWEQPGYMVLEKTITE